MMSSLLTFFKGTAVCVFFCLSSILGANAPLDLFAKYPNKYFVETGSYQGDGIQIALNAGFKQIYSVELSPRFYMHCMHRFSKNSHVKLFHGDSTVWLPKILNKIDAPATFWLDGHYSEGDTAKGKTNTPLLAELEAIRQHPIKTHTLLIDDVREFGKAGFDFITLEEIIDKVYLINPNYTISFQDGIVPNDILVAQIVE